MAGMTEENRFLGNGVTAVADVKRVIDEERLRWGVPDANVYVGKRDMTDLCEALGCTQDELAEAGVLLCAAWDIAEPEDSPSTPPEPVTLAEMIEAMEVLS